MTKTLEELRNNLVKAQKTYPKIRKLADGVTLLSGNPDVDKIKEVTSLISSELGSSHPLARDFTALAKEMELTQSRQGPVAGPVAPGGGNMFGGFNSFSVRTPNIAPVKPPTTSVPPKIVPLAPLSTVPVPAKSSPEALPVPSSPAGLSDPAALPASHTPAVPPQTPPAPQVIDSELADLLPEESLEMYSADGTPLAPDPEPEPELPDVFLSSFSDFSDTQDIISFEAHPAGAPLEFVSLETASDIPYLDLSPLPETVPSTESLETPLDFEETYTEEVLEETPSDSSEYIPESPSIEDIQPDIQPDIQHNTVLDPLAALTPDFVQSHSQDIENNSAPLLDAEPEAPLPPQAAESKFKSAKAPSSLEADDFLEEGSEDFGDLDSLLDSFLE